MIHKHQLKKIALESYANQLHRGKTPDDAWLPVMVLLSKNHVKSVVSYNQELHCTDVMKCWVLSYETTSGTIRGG